MEADKSKYDFVLDKVNSKLKIVAPTISYTGKNIQEVKKAISEIKNNVFKNNMDKNKDIADLETRYNSLFEQIKMYQREKKDMSGIKQYNINREKLLSSLQKIISDQPELAYLAKSIETLLRNLEEGVSFTDYIIKDQTVNKLEKELEQIKTEINKADSFFKMYSLPDKQKAIAVIEEYLDTDVKNVDDDAIDSLKKKISFLKREIKTLKNADDVSAINDFSKYITKLYLSMKDKSNFVEQDSKELGFRIKYIKKGNVLQPVKTYVDKESNKEYERNYYTGSMARHIVIQLCGYAAFLNKLLKDGKYPIVPIFVIDHISKAFDDENSKVIGDIIMYLLNDIGSENLQVFMFDSEKPEKLGINNKYSANLVSENKTGLCPFYKGS
ncbi:MAG: hypothetical protein J6Z08_03840 [Elusimicrobiales bacterium]|nr:hypothetical protein [Elusimicrobiales bacterium]